MIEVFVLREAAGVKVDDGIVAIENAKGVAGYLTMAKNARIWVREPWLRRRG